MRISSEDCYFTVSSLRLVGNAGWFQCSLSAHTCCKGCISEVLVRVAMVRDKDGGLVNLLMRLCM